VRLVVRQVLMLIIAGAVLYPAAANAQTVEPGNAAEAGTADQQQNVPAPAQQTEDTVERTVRRFGIGVEGGVGLDPELIAFGAHGTFGPIFKPNISFRPGIEFGVGEVTTTFGVNLDVLYTLPGATRATRWTPYAGAGPNFSLSHKGFQTGTGNGRFDFSDTSFESGLNFIAGVRNRSRLFLEMRATAYGVSNVRLLAGFTF
jgi:hypothetical protein